MEKSQTVLKACLDELLMRGSDDWLDLVDFVDVAVHVGHACSNDEARDLSMEVMRELVSQELVKIGELSPSSNDKGFRAWSMPPQECLDRVEREWKALGRNPSLSEICWLCNTPKGDAIGKELLKQRNAGA